MRPFLSSLDVNTKTVHSNGGNSKFTKILRNQRLRVYLRIKANQRCSIRIIPLWSEHRKQELVQCIERRDFFLAISIRNLNSPNLALPKTHRLSHIEIAKT